MKSERVRRLEEREEKIGAAARIVKDMLNDNASPFNTLYGVLNRTRVRAIETLLEAAGISGGKDGEY